MHEHDDYDASSGNGDYVEVSSEGESYHLDAEYDVDHDGVDDSSVVHHSDGSSTTYTDTDHDGDADYRVTVNADGQVTDQERHDEGSDEWVGMNEHAHGGDTGSDTTAHTGADTAAESHHGRPADDGEEYIGDRPFGEDGHDTSTDTSTSTSTSHDTGTDTAAASGEHVMVDTGHGRLDAGAAQYDLDGDGVKDTAVVTESDGDQMYLTDVDGDGNADVATEVDAEGNVVVYTESGADGDWEVAEAGHVDAQGDLDVDYTRR